MVCELCRSTNFGRTWERLSPHRAFIPPGDRGSFDSHTCYAAPPIVDPADSSSALLYYAGGDGPHSGHGVEHGRANFMARASAPIDAFAGLRAGDAGVGIVRSLPMPLGRAVLTARVGRAALGVTTTNSSISANIETLNGDVLLTSNVVYLDGVIEPESGSQELELRWSSAVDRVKAEHGEETLVVAIKLTGSAILFAFALE